MKFTHRDDAPQVMEKQAQVFLSKATVCQSLDLHDLPMAELLVLADSLFYYRVLAHLSVERGHFAAEEPEQGRSLLQKLERATSLRLYCTLSTVWLRHCRMDAAVLEALANWLPQLQALQGLGLAHNGIADAPAARLARGIKSNPLLRHVDLSHNCIADLGATSLAMLLRKSRSIEALHLASNQVQDKGAEALAQAIAENPVLQKLLLNQNSIGAQGAQALAEAACESKSLQTLYLHGNPFGGGSGCEGLEALARACQARPHLDFGQKSVDEAAQSFAESIPVQAMDLSPLSESARLQAAEIDLTSAGSLIDFLLQPSMPIRLLKGSYLRKLHWQGQLLPRRQQVPEDGFVSRQDLQQWKDRLRASRLTCSTKSSVNLPER